MCCGRILNRPYKLFVTPEFSITKLPLNIENTIYEVKELVLQSTFSIDLMKSINCCSIPIWISNFNHLEIIRFERVKIDELYILKDLPVQYMIFENVECGDSKKINNALKLFKHLKKISYDQSLSFEVINYLKGLKLKLTTITEDS